LDVPSRLAPFARTLRGYAALALSASALPACLEEQCERHAGDPLEYRGGNTSANGEYYETNSLDEPFLHFPTGRTYDLVHGLGAPPASFHAYLAFSECPLSKSVRNPGGSPSCEPVDAESGGGGFAEGSGNEAIFEVRSDEVLTIRNDTCAEFYLRVVATTIPGTSDGETSETALDAGQ
jgi:hypothetical protein